MARRFRPLRTQTSATSKASPEFVYDTIADLRAHLEWSGERASSETFKLLGLEGPQGPATAGTTFSSIGGRVVGDGGMYFYVQDVMVMPEFQGRGIGAAVMDAIMRYLEGATAGGAFVGLMAAEGSERFFQRYGFRRRPDDRPGMFRAVP